MKLFFTALLVCNAVLISLEKHELICLRDDLDMSSANFFGIAGVLTLLLTALALLTSLAIQRDEKEFDPLIVAVAAVYSNYKAIGILSIAFNKPPDQSLVIAIVSASIFVLAVAAYGSDRFKDRYYAFALGQCYLLIFVAICMVIVTATVNYAGQLLVLGKKYFVLNPGVAIAIVAIPYLTASLFATGKKMHWLYKLAIYGVFMGVIMIFAPGTVNNSLPLDEGTKLFACAFYALSFFLAFEWLQTKGSWNFLSKRYALLFILTITGVGLAMGIMLYLLMLEPVGDRKLVIVVHTLGAFLGTLVIGAFEFYFQRVIFSRLPQNGDQNSFEAV